jgi:hypothetical protein
MTVETHDKLIALLPGVDEMKTKEAQFKSEKTHHLEQLCPLASSSQSVAGSRQTSAMEA